MKKPRNSRYWSLLAQTHSTLGQMVKESEFKRLNWHISNTSTRDDSQSMTHIFTPNLRLSTVHCWKQVSHPQHSKNQWKSKINGNPSEMDTCPSSPDHHPLVEAVHLVKRWPDAIAVIWLPRFWIHCRSSSLNPWHHEACLRDGYPNACYSLHITSQGVCSMQKCTHVWAPINRCIDHHLPRANIYWTDAPEVQLNSSSTAPLGQKMHCNLAAAIKRNTCYASLYVWACQGTVFPNPYQAYTCWIAISVLWCPFMLPCWLTWLQDVSGKIFGPNHVCPHTILKLALACVFWITRWTPLFLEALTDIHSTGWIWTWEALNIVWCFCDVWWKCWNMCQHCQLARMILAC